MERARAFYREALGSRVGEPVALPEHGVSTAFMELGNTKLELLEPLGEHSPILGFLRKNPGGGIHHICLEVDHMATVLQQVRTLMLPPGEAEAGPRPWAARRHRTVGGLQPV
ncbi:methylmalonyl-CoA epimerase, mitochondrial-like [Mobula hypostoma]|uniref:methylmalonyl-CoA epimerase, mitochondrial-like n=1 Tax=Mobula hypostoma TaxID=723540 RepID=UPI002FC2BAF3